MHYDEVQPDTRVICHSRGEIKGTVLNKRPDGFGAERPVVRIKFDDGGEGWNYPEQLDPLDEVAPEPKLSRAYKGRSRFWIGGHEYEVFNSTGLGDVRGFWACVRVSEDSTTHPSDAHVVIGAATRKAAFERALGKLKARKIVTIKPRRYREITMSQEDQDLDAEPELRGSDRTGWAAAWHTDGFLIVFEDARERGIVWPGKPIEATAYIDGKSVDLDGPWPYCEAAVLAVRDAHLNR
ncbi:hypothetical protein [Streptomyces boncukensis]|uniref:Uncharacterized protein n=1 Tax=Streptomyces boncukensis TaxID=2711219 RepID=A0A6G4WSE4_9ACTN|nr:hypothetical protein [Streptomyces boncukensis]NGO68028.1 hypothetical protein [Streptomyces boncukensis]